MTTNFNDPSNPKRTDRIQLGDGFTVAREFFDEVCVWIKGRLVELPRNGVYTAKKLAGTDYWGQLPIGDERLAGRCIAFAVCHNLLPLEFVKGAHEYPLRYRPKWH